MANKVKVRVKQYSIMYHVWDAKTNEVKTGNVTVKTKKLTRDIIKEIEQGGLKYLNTISVKPFVTVYSISVLALAEHGEIISTEIMEG